MRIPHFEQPANWVAALGDERAAVRSTVLAILSELPAPPGEATEMAIHTVDRLGWLDAYEFTHLITNLPHTRHSFAWLTKRLATLLAEPHPSPETVHLAKWLNSAPIDWLRPALDHLPTGPPVNPRHDTDDGDQDHVADDPARDPLRHAAWRVHLASLPDDALDAQAQALLTDCANHNEFPHAEARKLEHIAREMAARGHWNERARSDWLHIPEPSDMRAIGIEDYQAAFALMLIAEARIAPPLAAMLRILELDWDWTNELYEKAMIAGSNNLLISQLMDVYPSLDWYGRLFSTSAIERCAQPEHEMKLQSLIEAEEDYDLALQLAMGLTLRGSEQGRAFARRLAMRIPDDPESRELLDRDCVRQVVLGMETDATHQHIERMEAELLHRKARLNNPFSAKSPTPFKQSAPKPGRNDPCPCGSGIKYKKCCLQKDS